MRIKLVASCAVIALFPLSVVFPRAAAAQVNIQVQVPLPTIRFETAPVLVEVSPGVQVVEDYDQEVFFVDGWYWYRSGPRWYHTRDHRGGWVVVHEREVPPTLVRFPPGRYRHYKSERPHGNERRRERGPHGHDVEVRHEERRDNHHNEHQEHNHHNETRHNDHQEHGQHQEHQESNHSHR